MDSRESMSSFWINLLLKPWNASRWKTRGIPFIYLLQQTLAIIHVLICVQDLYFLLKGTWLLLSLAGSSGLFSPLNPPPPALRVAGRPTSAWRSHRIFSCDIDNSIMFAGSSGGCVLDCQQGFLRVCVPVTEHWLHLSSTALIPCHTWASGLQGF